MAPLQIRSLFLKVVMPIMVLVLTSMAAVSFFAMKAMGEGVRAVALERAEYGLEAALSRVEEAMHESVGDHGRDLQAAMVKLGRNPDLDAVRILSASGHVLYASNPADIGQILPVHLSAPATPAALGGGWRAVEARADVLHAVRPILNRPRCVACHADGLEVLAFVDVDISLSRQSAGMRAWRGMAMATVIAQFVIIGVGIALILGRVVVHPLRRLSASMRQLQHGNLHVAATPPGTAELDDVVDGFNDMVTRLRRARRVEEDAQRSHLTRVEQLAALGEMAASLAHEIRNPLSGTKAAVDVLAAEEKAEEPRRILQHVSQELARVDGVVRQLLAFAKPKTPVPAKVDLGALLQDAVMFSGPRATKQGARLELQSSSESLHVLADRDMVQQVVINLILNALQALEGTPAPVVVLSTAVRDGWVECAVRDNGPGVPVDRAATIFRPFMTTKPRGTGLGLATSRRLIELQGGRLWLENPGVPGACFMFTLPVFTTQLEAGA